MLNTPILFLVFNRLNTTKLVFSRIREAKPTRLFIAADGPREWKEGEYVSCEEVRKFILDGIDWECEVQTLFRSENLGCGLAVSSAITWFFEYVEEGIILEDDCLPDNAFFLFCTSMLAKYRDNDVIGHISGASFYGNNSESYYYSNYPHVWGWAGWRKNWCNYQYEIRNLDVDFNTIVFNDKIQNKFWKKKFKKQKLYKLDTWDYQYMYGLWSQNVLSITPESNLIQNIGINKDATHTNSIDDCMIKEIKTIYTIKYNSEVRVDFERDKLLFYNTHYLWGKPRGILYYAKIAIRNGILFLKNGRQ